ncbi:MAG: LCP family protein [Chloroflexi bacterium]|nr:LCP family protein [Chloroflexota bacterium]
MKRISPPLLVVIIVIGVVIALALSAPSSSDAPFVSGTTFSSRSISNTNETEISGTSSVETNSPLSHIAPNTASGKIETSDQLSERKLVKPSETIFDALAKPLVNEAYKRREERRKTEPDFAKRIDAKLNDGRINILLFGYGESHEPPATEKAIIGSHTIISYQFVTGKADLISFTHDIRGPEIEQTLKQRGFKSPAVRIDQAYNVGGFALQRKMIEDATGLVIDFQVTFKDVVIQNMIDQVFGTLEVDVPVAFKVYPFYLEGRKYPAGSFPKGSQNLSGTQVIQFIKTVPNSDGGYEKSLEHNQRKHIILQGLLNALSKRRAESSLWLKMTGFLTKEMVTGTVVYDFDPIPLVVKNVNETTTAISKFMASEKSSALTLPQIHSSIYIVDAAIGDGGVQWVNANGSINPITQRDLSAGIYTSPDIEVPLNANPYGDLVNEYWPSVRELVKRTIMTN